MTSARIVRITSFPALCLLLLFASIGRAYSKPKASKMLCKFGHWFVVVRPFRQVLHIYPRREAAQKQRVVVSHDTKVCV